MEAPVLRRLRRRAVRARAVGSHAFRFVPDGSIGCTTARSSAGFYGATAIVEVYHFGGPQNRSAGVRGALIVGERGDGHRFTTPAAEDAARSAPVMNGLVAEVVGSSDAGGGLSGASVTAREVGALVQAQRRAEAAGAVSHALSESRLDVPMLLSLIARQIGHALGDSCVLADIAADGSFGEIVYHHEDPAAIELLEQIIAVSSPSSTEGLMGQVVASGVPLRLGEMGSGQLRALIDERYWPYLERFPMHASLIVPLRYDGQPVGVFAISRNSPGRPFTDADEAFAVDLANRAALAIANARLYQDARRELEHRRRTEEELEASEDRFRRVAENAPVVLFRYDVSQRRLVYVSPAITELLGYTPDELYADDRMVFGAADHDDAQRSIAYYQRLAEQTDPLVTRRRHRDGREVWIETRAVPVMDNGRLVAIEGITTDITSARRAEAELVRHASYDDLTGLANRSLLLDHLNLAIAHRPVISSGLAVLFIDLDRFKVINESLGHNAGDRVIQQAAQRLITAVRPADTVARLGGDEFAVLITDNRDNEVAVRVAERILAAFREPFTIDDRTVMSTVSVGIAHAQPTSTDLASDLMRHADAAVYLAKEHGRDRWEVFDENLRPRLHERLKIETELRRGLENGEFRLHYQPVFRLRDQTMTGVEALLRWQHPDGALRTAATFIEVVEDCGLIGPLGDWVFGEAGRQLRAWQQQALGLDVAVNLSAEQINNPQMMQRVIDQISEHLNPAALCVEITETALMSDIAASTAALTALKDLGVQLAVDDFGTGYSSLSHLQRFPVDIVKIDKSFVDGLGTNHNDTQIVKAIISLAHALDLTAIAEGVESQPQLDALIELGCDMAQGYLLGRPAPPDNIDARLKL